MFGVESGRQGNVADGADGGAVGRPSRRAAKRSYAESSESDTDSDREESDAEGEDSEAEDGEVAGQVSDQDEEAGQGSDQAEEEEDSSGDDNLHPGQTVLHQPGQQSRQGGQRGGHKYADPR